jgi:CheY-like chemotaxis protein
MDIHTSEIDGFEAAGQLYEFNTQIRVPIFALTANIEVGK